MSLTRSTPKLSVRAAARSAAPRAFESLAGVAEQRLAAMHENLPDDAPQDWVSLGSAVLFDEYERKVREVGAKLNPSVSPEIAPVLRRQFEAICVSGPAPFDPASRAGSDPRSGRRRHRLHGAPRRRGHPDLRRPSTSCLRPTSGRMSTKGTVFWRSASGISSASTSGPRTWIGERSTGQGSLPRTATWVGVG